MFSRWWFPVVVVVVDPLTFWAVLRKLDLFVYCVTVDDGCIEGSCSSPLGMNRNVLVIWATSFYATIIHCYTINKQIEFTQHNLLRTDPFSIFLYYYHQTKIPHPMKSVFQGDKPFHGQWVCVPEPHWDRLPRIAISSLYLGYLSYIQHTDKPSTVSKDGQHECSPKLIAPWWWVAIQFIRPSFMRGHGGIWVKLSSQSTPWMHFSAPKIGLPLLQCTINRNLFWPSDFSAVYNPTQGHTVYLWVAFSNFSVKY